MLLSAVLLAVLWWRGESGKPLTTLPSVDLSALTIGEHSVLPHPLPPRGGELPGGYDWGLLAYRSSATGLHLWQVPVVGKAIGLPDVRWWRPIYACQQFVLQQPTDLSARFVCIDPKPAQGWWLPHWQWSQKGQSLSTLMDDLIEAPGVFQGSHFVFTSQTMLGFN